MNHEITEIILSRITDLCGSHFAMPGSRKERPQDARSGMPGSAQQHPDGSGQAVTPVLTAIDGRCCSGKTTLALQLSEQLTAHGISCSVIHMDDFFLRPAQRTGARLAEPGGNIDYERFTTEVLEPLSRQEAFAYRPYNCRRQELGAPVPVKQAQVILIEGSYSCHPRFRDFWHLRIFMTVEEKTQLSRIEKRNGSAALPLFRERWIPMEEQYFHAFSCEESCEFILDTTR